MDRLARLISIMVWLQVSLVAWADDAPSYVRHRSAESLMQAAPFDPSCRGAQAEGFENLQIETSNIRLHEQLFEELLHAAVVQRLDHPLTDSLRAYCYRKVLVVIRQDLRTPRPTGWVQLNFTVPNVAAVQQELESAYRTSSISQLSEEERDKIVRFRLKPDVMRGDQRVVRLEVYGPEGFLIGFDQPKER